MIGLLPFLVTGALAAPAPRSIPTSDYTVQFTRQVPVSNARREERLRNLNYARSLAGSHSPEKRWVYTQELNAPGGAGDYSLPVTIGNEFFEVIADTGSSDLWVPSAKFNCVNVNGTAEPQSYCNFGPHYYTKDPGFQGLGYKNNFNITYGDGNFATGYAGKETVAVGGLSVPHTEFSVVTNSYWSGDGYTNGLLGLANPLSTSVFYGTNPTVDSAQNYAEYDPWFYKAVDQNLVEHPYFSVVLNRPTLAQENTTNTVFNLGSITFGGIPNNVPTTSTTVTVPNQLFPGVVNGQNVTQPVYYTVIADSFNFPGSNQLNTKTPLTILDTGTTLIYLPNHIANKFNSHWSPAAKYSSDEGAFIVDCDAKAPWFSVTIGGQTFGVTSQDLIYPSETQPGKCISSVLRGGKDQQTDVFILGDRFLVNVIPTFNIKTDEITITQRQPY